MKAISRIEKTFKSNMLYRFKWFELKGVRTFAQVKYVNKHVIHPLFLQMMEKVSMFDLILKLLTINFPTS